MATFIYEGLDKKGKKVFGTVEDENDNSVRAGLKEKGLYIISVQEKRKQELFHKRVNAGDLALSVRELATLLNSGLTLDESLSGLTNQMRHGSLKDMYVDVQKQIREGKSFSKAVSFYPASFSDISVSMLRVGEASGKLGLVLEKIAQFMEEKMAFRNKILGIMTYPILMSVVGVFILIFILTFVAPTLTGIFKEISMKLPLATRMILGLSYFLRRYAVFILLCIGLAIFLARRYFSTPSGKLNIDRLRYRLPFLKDLFLKSEIMNFTRTLGTLLESGVDILSSFAIAREVIFSPMLKKEIEQVGDMVSHGHSVSMALQKTSLFPYTVVQLVSAGERSGQLPQMLRKIASNFQEEVSQRAGRLVTILEPVMILFMAIIVGFVVVGIMLPIFQISQSIR